MALHWGVVRVMKDILAVLASQYESHLLNQRMKTTLKRYVSLNEGIWLRKSMEHTRGCEEGTRCKYGILFILSQMTKTDVREGGNPVGRNLNRITLKKKNRCTLSKNKANIEHCWNEGDKNETETGYYIYACRQFGSLVHISTGHIDMIQSISLVFFFLNPLHPQVK